LPEESEKPTRLTGWAFDGLNLAIYGNEVAAGLLERVKASGDEAQEQLSKMPSRTAQYSARFMVWSVARALFWSRCKIKY